MKEDKISQAEVDRYLAKCAGLRVADVWRGAGTAIFLELGKLHPHRGNKRPPASKGIGDITVMIEWSWRIEKLRSIHSGSFDSDREISNRIKILQGKIVKQITIAGRLPEITVEFEGNIWLRSLATERGQPEWGLIYHRGGWLGVRRGKVVHGTP